MSTEDFWNFVRDFTDYLDSQEKAVRRLKGQIAKLVGTVEKPKWSWNPSKIRWKKAEGARGEFEKSEDYNNPEFRAMLKDLREHGGKLTRDGVFYWVYRNGSTVGRKPKRGLRNDW